MATLAELRAEAKRQKRKGYSKLKKAELEKLLNTPPPKPPRGVPRKKPEPVKKAPAKKAPAKKAGYTIKEVKNDNELKEVVKQYIRNWVSRPAQQREYNKIPNTSISPSVEIKRVLIKAIKGSGSFYIKGTAFSKANNRDARDMALDIDFQLNQNGKKAPYKIEPNFDDTTMTIYTDRHPDTEYPVFVEFANAGNRDLDFQSVESAENFGLSTGISFARESDEGAFTAKRASTEAYRKRRAKEKK